MKFLIDFMVDSVRAVNMQEKKRESERKREDEKTQRQWQEPFKQPRRGKRTRRDAVGTLELADDSPPYPHHKYVNVNVNAETAPKKRRLLGFNPYEEELEQRRSKGIVIRDREKDAEKKKKKKKEKYNDDDDFKTEKKGKKKKQIDQGLVDLPEPKLSDKLKAQMVGKAQEFGLATYDDTKAVLVIQKLLQQSDIVKQQNRLTIPNRQAKAKFLSPDEELRISEKHEGHVNKIYVPIIEPAGNTPELPLSKWNVGKKSVSYILNGGWSNVVSNNQLEEGQIVQVWAFWIRGKLNLAFDFSEKLKKKPKKEEEEASTSQALVEPAAEPLILTQGDNTPPAADGDETEESSGSEDSNMRSQRSEDPQINSSLAS